MLLESLIMILGTFKVQVPLMTIIIYNLNIFIVQATVITYEDHHIFIVQATGYNVILKYFFVTDIAAK
jgi:hypothetical protein